MQLLNVASCLAIGCKWPIRPVQTRAACVIQVDAALKAAKAFNPAQLCIEPGRAAWAAYLDMYILDNDGALLDACLLAAACTLRTLHLPQVSVTDEGNVRPFSISIFASSAVRFVVCCAVMCFMNVLATFRHCSLDK